MEPDKKDLDYNERADGYGSQGSEKGHAKQEYEKEREEKKKTQGESSTKDEHGQPNQQGEVDQYSFRDKP